MSSKTCSFCYKTGFPILPVRYAVAPISKDGSVFAPALPRAGFQAPPMPIGSAPLTYAVRLLRAGFLYVYSGKHKNLTVYYISEGSESSLFKGAFLYPLTTPPLSSKSNDEQLKSAAAKPEIDASPCNDKGHQESPLFITVKDDDTIVYLAYSEACWTEDILKKCLNDSDFRKKHMREFNVAEWKKKREAVHAAKIEALGGVVMEYYGKVKPYAREVWHYSGMIEDPNGDECRQRPLYAEPFNFRLYKHEAKPTGSSKLPRPYNMIVEDPEAGLKVVEKARELCQGKDLGVIVAVDDPSGILTYVNNRGNWLLADFAADSKNQRNWKLFTASSLEIIKKRVVITGDNERIKEAAKVKLKALSKDINAILRHIIALSTPHLAAQIGNGDDDGAQNKLKALQAERDRLKQAEKKALDPETSPSERRQALEEISEITGVPVDELTESGAEMWQKYLEYIDEPAKNKFMAEYNAELETFKKDCLDSLGEYQAKLLCHKYLWQHCITPNFSTTDLDSGEAFAITFLNWITGGPENYAAVHRLISSWIENPVSTENLFFRALLLNHEEDLKKLKKVAGGSGEGQEPETVDEIYDEGRPLSETDLVQVIYETAISEERALIGKLPYAVGAVMAEATNPLVMHFANLKGRHTKATQRQLRMVLRALGFVTGETLVKVSGSTKSVLEAAARYFGDSPKRVVAEFEKSHRRMNTPVIRRNAYVLSPPPEGLAGVKNKMNKAMRTGGYNFEVLRLGDLFDINISRMKSMGKEVSNGAASALSGVFSAVMLVDILSDWDEASSEDYNKLRMKILGYALGVGENFCYVWSTVVKNFRTAHLTKAGKSLLSVRSARILKVGAGLGIASGVAFAASDGLNAYEAWQLDNYITTCLYGVSASISIATAVVLSKMALAGFSLSAMTGVGLLFVAMIVVVSAFISYFSDPPTEIWMRKCYFTKNQKLRYNNLRDERIGLEKALSPA